MTTLRPAPVPEAHREVTTPETRAPAAIRRPLMVAGLCLVVALGAIAGAIAEPRTPGLEVLVGAGLLAAFAAAGSFATLRRPDERLGSLIMVVTTLAALGVLAHLILRDSGTSWLRSAAEIVGAVAGGLAPVVAMHLLLGLPDGTCRLKRSVLATGYVAGAVISLWMWLRRPSGPGWLLWAEIAIVVPLGIAGSSRRYGLSRGVERRRMQWFGWAAAVSLAYLLVAAVCRLLWGWPTLVSLVLALALAPFGIATVLASSHRYSERVEAILSRTVTFLGLVAVTSVILVVVFVGYGPTLGSTGHVVLALALLASALAAVAFRALRGSLARQSDALLHGRRLEAPTPLALFGSRLSRAIPMDELLLQVAESLQTSLDLDVTEIWTGSAGRLERAVSVPTEGPATIVLSPEEEAVVARAGLSGRAWIELWLPSLLADSSTAPARVVPATHSGQVLGLVVAIGHPGREPFGPTADAMLSELARQIGLALHNVALDSALQASLDEVRRQAEELQASRARIVAASDAARRQIERNLHDGAQQHLVALAVNLRLARRLAETDPGASGELLDQLGESLNDAVQELRTLAHGIYPPLLVDRGLAEALQSAAGRAALPTDVEAAGLDRYSPEEEAAAYFCCMEALQNAGKHAGEGATVSIRVWEEAGALLFEVRDTGAGFDTRSFGRSGAGFQNMSDRVGAIGGSVKVESAAGIGTTVSGRLPISR